MTYVFSGLAIIMGLSLVVSLCIGEFTNLNIHLTAYGFILAGIGYLIELIKRREKNVDMTIEYVLDKKMKNIAEEVKSVRMMMLKLDERRDGVKEKESNEPIKIEYKIPIKEK